MMLFEELYRSFRRDDIMRRRRLGLAGRLAERESRMAEVEALNALLESNIKQAQAAAAAVWGPNCDFRRP